ncbi:hypothetical protein TTHERM_000756079 (macronuclear) [Tetrahymena thermophila SB210]|uniref:Uncharacterized protein n=1 Tax=Tetrahymena thermophila (strain SB210) TaxID=312017 RepID=W7X5S4_TETTS|nr:hypothetical protein TTHERM_000756079 [Tetrahymena thermophila SB210]EWS71713.1 hypothetical protein TTHERM_000756079 [Tetrahymena thermophila SB210]|eukprot:XP_012655754.1 hypothetical protein TTHERM_000756079 [Tetrahymena thermophila SB210]
MFETEDNKYFMEVEAQSSQKTQQQQYMIAHDEMKYNLRSKNKDSNVECNQIEDTKSDNYQIAKCQKKIVKDKENVSKKRYKKVSWIKIEYPLNFEFIYPLVGHVVVDISTQDKVYVKNQIKQVEQNCNNFTIYSDSIESLAKFGFLIHIFENSQSQIKLQYSILLKKYQDVVIQQVNLLDQLKKEMKTPQFQQLVQDRKKFKLQFIQTYVKENFTDEDFYVICNVGTNFQSKSSNVESICFSKSYSSLLGLSEEQVQSMYLRNSFPFLVLSQKGREQLSMQYLQCYLQQDQKQPVVIKDFEVKTFDGLSLFCNNKKYLVQVPYPQQLRHPKLDQLHALMDNINVQTVDIDQCHLRYIIENRSNKKQIRYQDFEYSLMSSIFMEKFYPKKLLEIEKQEQSQEKEEILQEQIQNLIQQQEQKRCSYKNLIFDQF